MDMNKECGRVICSIPYVAPPCHLQGVCDQNQRHQDAAMLERLRKDTGKRVAKLQVITQESQLSFTSHYLR